jgi:tetratricopeptide (TPR) repeat protein
MGNLETTSEAAEVTAVEVTTARPEASSSRMSRILFLLIAVAAVAYGFLNGFRTIAEFDLGWQMATARWIAEHHQIPSVDVLSYTAAGQPWIYPVGAGLFFYGAFLVGGYALISWLTAFTCAGVTAIVLRRGSLVTAALALLAVPLIATRVTARAEMFTVLLFAATLSLLWQQHEDGNARLWILPILMAAWVNLHPGFVAGMGLLAAYVGIEILDLLWLDRRASAIARLKRAWPWLAATVGATLLNPWGWKVFEVIARQEAAMGAHSQLILEWAPIPLNWTRLVSGLAPLNPDEFYVLLAVVMLTVPIALVRREFGAAILLTVAAIEPLRHMRFTALFGVVVAIVAGGVLTSLARDLFAHTLMGKDRTGKDLTGSDLIRKDLIGKYLIENNLLRKALKPRLAAQWLRPILAAVVLVPLLILAATRSRAMWTNNSYLAGTNLVSFGTGLSWWFPERAAAFIEKENLPGPIFSSIEEGAYLAFRLGPKYKDYIDGRAIPFGSDAMVRASRLKASPPESPLWRAEVDRYDINVMLVPLGRFAALQFFPMLRQFCQSDEWRPVYLDEVSVVFLRKRPETEDVIARLQINCATAPLPATPPAENRATAFNQWANAASVLHALGRDGEALAAANQALEIVPNGGYLHFLRGHMEQEVGNLAAAEHDYLDATRMEPNLVAPWSALAAFDQERGRLPEAINAWKHAADVSRWPWEPLVNLGYADLQAHRPQDALTAFDRAADSLPSHYELMVDNSVLANIAHGRSRSWLYLGNLRRAISFDEQAAQLLPDPDLWMQLANLYDQAGRFDDANRLRAQAMALAQRQ